MSLLSHLRSLLQAGPEPAALAPHERAVAALLVLVARADGLLREVEEDALRAHLRDRFGLSEAGAHILLADAESFNEAEGAADLVEQVLSDVEPADRPDLLAAAYRIAGADGRIDEVEDDLVWRIGRLLGLTERDIAAVRGRALAAG